MELFESPSGPRLILEEGMLPSSALSIIHARRPTLVVSDDVQRFTSLDFLLAAAEYVDSLEVRSTGVVDLSAIEAMTQLKDLSVDPEVRAQIDITKLRQLRTLDCNLDQLVFDSSQGLDYARLWSSKGFKTLPDLRAPRELYLHSGRALPLVLPALRDPERLQRLSLTKFKQVDLTSVKDFIHLQELIVESTPTLTGCSGLDALKGLRTVGFYNVYSVDNVQTLARLSPESLLINGGSRTRELKEQLAIARMAKPAKIVSRDTRPIWWLYPGRPAQELSVAEIPSDLPPADIVPPSQAVFRDFWRGVTEWAQEQGANELQYISWAGGAPAIITKNLNAGWLRRIQEDPNQFGGLTLAASGAVVLELDDSLDQGVLIHAIKPPKV